MTVALGVTVMATGIADSRPALAEMKNIGRETRYGVTCMVNETEGTINFEYRWGKEKWKSRKFNSGDTWRSWWEYDRRGRFVSPNLQIRFDEDMTSRARWVTYTLKRNRSPDNGCKSAKVYLLGTNRSGDLVLFKK